MAKMKIPKAPKATKIEKGAEPVLEGKVEVVKTPLGAELVLDPPTGHRRHLPAE